MNSWHVVKTCPYNHKWVILLPDFNGGINMKSLGRLASATALVAAALLSGCASIISGSHDDIMVKTDPEGADCTVYQGAEVLGHVNPTPGGIVVPRSYNDIFVRCVKEDYEGEAMNTSGLNGWVFGNIIFGLIGAPIGVIVDTSTSNATSYDPATHVAMIAKPKPPVVAPEQPLEPAAAEPEVVAVEITPAAVAAPLD